jgi:RHS repeat-associated protein
VRDPANHITEIHDPLGGVTYQTYDADGRLSTRALPNGITTTWGYDSRSRIHTIVHARADASVIASVTYDRNPSGEPYRITREDGTFVLYGYDSALRLTSERYFDATSTQVDAITYQYDDDGNRTLRTTSAGTETYTYDPGSELRDITVGTANVAHYDYDAAGRVTHRTRGTIEQNLTYDADDHLVRVADPAGTNETLWDFDAMGRRVRREDRSGGVTTGAHRFQIAPTLSQSLESPHAVTDDAGHAQTEYVFAGEHPLFRYDATTGAVVYYLQDSMGSVIGLADTTAASTSTIQYDGFGVERSETGMLATLPMSTGGDFRFQGMWLDSGTGLYHVRRRVYSAADGRFLSRDAIGTTERPETLNPFAFANSTPTVMRDPSGAMSAADNTIGLMATMTVATILALTALPHPAFDNPRGARSPIRRWLTRLIRGANPEPDPDPDPEPNPRGGPGGGSWDPPPPSPERYQQLGLVWRREIEDAVAISRTLGPSAQVTVMLVNAEDAFQIRTVPVGTLLSPVPSIGFDEYERGLARAGDTGDFTPPGGFVVRTNVGTPIADVLVTGIR